MKPVFSALLLAMAISGCEGGSETPTEQPLKFEDVPVVEPADLVENKPSAYQVAASNPALLVSAFPSCPPPNAEM